jgi:hypothetical protein
VDGRPAAAVPDLTRPRQGDAAVRTNLATNWRVALQKTCLPGPGATAGFGPGDRLPGVRTHRNMSHESQDSVPPETERDD